MKKNAYTVLGLLLVAVLVAAVMLTSIRKQQQTTPQTATYSSEVPLAWFDLQLRLVKTSAGFTPPVASRAFGYSGLALYEAVVNGMPDRQSLAGQLNGLPRLPGLHQNRAYLWDVAANSALAEVTRGLFTYTTEENKRAITALEAGLNKKFRAADDPQMVRDSQAYGKSVADAILAWATSDGGNKGESRNFSKTFVPPVGDGLWVRTPPMFQPALQPTWGENRSAIPNAVATCEIAPPPAYSTDPASEFYKQAHEVYSTVKNNTPEQKLIALFWADDPEKTSTPPGHWISITNQYIKEHGVPLSLAAEAYVKVGIAVSDAFIACWHTKYIHNLVRPISYIRANIDPNWDSPIITDPVLTPPFPEYPSGHSTQSAAAAAVLTALFGDKVAFTDHTGEAQGFPPRTFSSFDQAAEEAALSRLYGGIHYRAAIDNGLTQGKCIAKQVNALHFQKQ